MKKLLIIAALVLAGSVPASAQIYFGAGPGGVGVGVGGPGYGPDYGWRHRGYYRDAYAGDCRVVRQRIVTRYGRVIYRMRQICD